MKNGIALLPDRIRIPLCGSLAIVSLLVTGWTTAPGGYGSVNVTNPLTLPFVLHSQRKQINLPVSGGLRPVYHQPAARFGWTVSNTAIETNFTGKTRFGSNLVVGCTNAADQYYTLAGGGTLPIRNFTWGAAYDLGYGRVSPSSVLASNPSYTNVFEVLTVTILPFYYPSLPIQVLTNVQTNFSYQYNRWIYTTNIVTNVPVCTIGSPTWISGYGYYGGSTWNPTNSFTYPTLFVVPSGHYTNLSLSVPVTFQFQNTVFTVVYPEFEDVLVSAICALSDTTANLFSSYGGQVYCPNTVLYSAPILR